LTDYHGFVEYFSLLGPRPVFGKGGQENRQQLVLFTGVALGAICKVVYDAFVNSGSLEWKSFIVSLIASVVVFPQLYYAGGLNSRRRGFAHWALAFQNGFFWNVALSALFKKYGA
jgi:hypothetical protein